MSTSLGDLEAEIRGALGADRHRLRRQLLSIRQAQKAGKVRFLGFSGYPQKIFRFVCDQAAVDCVLSYNQYTLQNSRFADETIPYLKAKGVGIMNAGPFSARLLTNAPLPAWLKEPEPVKAAARAAAVDAAGGSGFAAGVWA